MPNESSGKDLHIVAGHFDVRLLLNGVMCVTKCQHPSKCFSYCSFPGQNESTFSGNFQVKQMRKLRWNFTCTLLDEVSSVLQNVVDFHGWSWPVSVILTSIALPFTSIFLIKAALRLGQGYSDYSGYSSIMQKDIFDHNFWTKVQSFILFCH